MRRFIGLTPVPPDADMSTFIDSVMSRDRDFLEFILTELENSKETTENDHQPYNFTYGKLLRFIQSLSEADRTHLTAISLWTILENKKVIDELGG